MEVLKDYPKEFAKLFQPSFNYLSKINMKFFFKNENFVGKYWRFLYIIPCLVINYITLGFHVAKLAAKGQIFEIAYLLPPFLISTQAILKATILFPKTSLLATIMKELGALWRKTGLNETQINARHALLKKVSCCNGITYWVSIIGTSQYLMTPLVETLVRRLIMKQDCVLMLPIECSYPFDPTSNWLVYVAVYAFQTYSTFLCVSVYTGSELMMITLCAFLGVEFTLLGEDVLNVKPEYNKIEGNKELASDKVNTKEQVTIGDIVKRHQQLCTLSTKLDEAFNQMIFINLLFVGLTTCFFRYAAQFSRGPTYMINNYTAVFSSLLYVLYMCYYGELLTGASLRIGEMAYHNLWYKGDKQYQKTICIIIKRSQKPCCVTSMKYAPITLNMFTKVMSSTWSYVSLMNTVYNEEN